MKTRLTRFPFPASEDDYARASAELEGRLAELPGVVAVYRTGNVSVAGISDIDRIAVVRPESRVPEIWSILSGETRSLAMHGPFLVDTTTFAKHRLFADLQPLELLSGEAVEVQARPAPEEHIELLIAAESLVVFTLKLVKQAVAGRVKVRPTLCELNNLRHDLRLGRVQPADAPGAWSFADQVTHLREEWWGLSEEARASRFGALLHEALPAAAEALLALSAKCSSDGSRPGPLLLTGAWKNVLLSPGDPVSAWRPSRLAGAAAHSARLAEGLWRWRPHELAVPGPVISLLQGSPGYENLRSERQRIVSSYVGFLARTKSYSGIGVAGVFRP